jgi:proteasome activator subunit 4
MKRQTRAKLARFYFELTVMPGLDPRLIDLTANMTMYLIESKKRIDIRDLQLPWKPIYNLLERELFRKQRETRTA